MNQKPLFSVIVPVYNVEQFLQETIDSVQNQTFNDYELILVDDGSTDDSGVICDNYSKIHSNIRVIHKDNGGIVSARKAGAKIATGEYTVCLDGDDWVDHDLLYHIKNVICQNNSPDIICFGLIETDGKDERISSIHSREGYYSDEDIKTEIYPMLIQKDDATYFSPSLCGKAIKTVLYNEVQQGVDERIVIGEDGVCTIPCVYRAKSMFVLREYLYFYRKNMSSVTKKKKVLSFDMPLLNAAQIEKSLDISQYDFQEQLYRKIVHDVFLVVKSQFYMNKGFFVIRKKVVKQLERLEYDKAITNATFRNTLKGVLLVFALRHKMLLPFKLYSSIE